MPFQINPKPYFSTQPLTKIAMLLRPTPPNCPANYAHANHAHLRFSNSVSFTSSLLLWKTKLISSAGHELRTNNPVFVTRSYVSKVRSNRSIDYEKRPLLNWKSLCSKISLLDSTGGDSVSVLNQIESEGTKLPKWELATVVKELRRFKRYKAALEVSRWINGRADKCILTSSDAAIQLDLIAIVDGVQQAEQYFHLLPDGMKDRRLFGSLLNAYVRVGMREEAESLVKKMKNRGYAAHPLPFNVMMTLYMKFQEYDKIETLVLEMKEKNVPLDVCTYNIWLASCGNLGSIEKMEQVFNQMQLDSSVKPSWSTFSTMATMYIKSGDFEKAENCLRKVQSRMNGRDREPYHYLIRYYGMIGKKEEVYRMWGTYKAAFGKLPNVSFRNVIDTLIKVGDIDGAEKLYNEWLSVKSKCDSRIGNLLLTWYVKEGLSDKAEVIFNQMIEAGGKPNALTWEILSEDNIRQNKIREAISCLQNAVAAAAEWSGKWKPKPANVWAILEMCKREDDTASKDALMEVLRQVGCLDDSKYMSNVYNGVQVVGDVENEDCDSIFDQFEGIL